MKSLSKDEMKKVMGGVAAGGQNRACSLTTYDADGNADTLVIHTNSESCSGAGQAANNSCVDLIVTQGTGVYHCGYRCEGC